MGAWRCQHSCMCNNGIDTCELAPCLRVVRIEHTQRHWVLVSPDLDEETSHRVSWCTHSDMQCMYRRCKPMIAANQWINILGCTLIDAQSTMHHTWRQSHDRAHTTAGSRGLWRRSGTPGASLSPRGTGSLRIQSSLRSPPHAPVCITHAILIAADTGHAHAHEQRSIVLGADRCNGT